MIQAQYPNAFTEGKGTIRLIARVSIPGIGNLEAEVIEANAETQTAEVKRRGGQFPIIVQFSAIQNVALKYDDGTIVQNFGAPKANKPATIAYIQFAEVQA
jgi:hypothetical protein